MIPALCSGTLVFVGDRLLDGMFADFIVQARRLSPTWDGASATLSAMLPGESEPLVVNHDTGASRGGHPLQTRRARITTPWGSLPLGTLAFSLATPYGDYSMDLREIVAALEPAASGKSSPSGD